MRKFIEQSLQKYHNENEPILLVGDYNVDSRKPYINKGEVLQYPAFEVFLNKSWSILIILRKMFPTLKKDDFLNEYEDMVFILAGDKDDKILDLLIVKYI